MEGLAETVDFAGDEDLEAIVDCRKSKRSAVKCLVVEPAQRQTIEYLVGAARCVPFYVGGFDPDQFVSETDVKFADGASSLVLSQHFMTEGGVARLRGRVPHLPGARDADGFPDVVVQ